ncbi:hypothetical protein MPTA5024_27770 [Microbispora sp. ATCC PTA-5024]|nr:hypothetical protein MPTA5024_27770 [Microbispora sp. ATCC PTA-5024]
MWIRVALIFSTLRISIFILLSFRPAFVRRDGREM